MKHLLLAMRGSRRFAAVLSVSLATAALGAQDTLIGPHGGTSGTAYELRAAAENRIKELTFYNGGFVDGLRILWGNRSSNPSGPTPVVGNTTGALETFRVPDGDYLVRVDVWTSVGFVNQVRVVTARGVEATFGSRQTNDVRRNFPAGARREIVGLFGHAGALVSSVGVITRPVLGSVITEGFDNRCYTSRGTLVSLLLAPGSPAFTPGASPQLQINSLLRVPTYFMVYGVSNRIWAGVPLPLDLGPLGAPNCFVRASLDVLVPLGSPDIFGRLVHTVPVPNDTGLIGGSMIFQNLVLDAGANARGVVLSNSLIGLVGAI